MDPTNRVWGSKLREGQDLRCARCYASLVGEEAYSCLGCQATYDRACLSTNRQCSCGSTRFARHEPPKPAVGLFASMGAAIKRVIHGS
ncbi:MAG: hypothetical protein KDD82_02740 [Planctomycetes bacterium]|nr:hypothetical protein [Planctomycetota bacterium]